MTDDIQNLGPAAVPVDPRARLQALRDEHRQLDARINDLAGRPYLTGEDQIELARLKKQKLRKKDEIFSLATELGVEL